MRSLALCAAAAALPGARGEGKCDVTQCVAGSCDPTCCIDTPLHRYPLNVSAWDPVGRSYQLVGQADAWYAWDDTQPLDPIEDDTFKLGTFMHGPHFDGGYLDVGSPTPPTYVSATTSGKVLLFDGFDEGMTAAKKKVLAWTDAPSTQYNIRSGGRATHMLVADGAPFWVAPAENGTMWKNRGGVHVVRTSPPHDASQCTKIFPNEVDNPVDIPTGRVVNTVDCHADTGFCFFSAWKFDGKQSSIFPDCLHWCLLDDPREPTKCILGGVLTDEHGEKICHNTDSTVPPVEGGVGGGGVHGFTIGRQGAGLEADLDLFLVYTGGPDATNKAAGCNDTFACGASWVRKARVHIKRDDQSPRSSSIAVLSTAPWGAELWNDTIADHSVADVGCDHAWMDATGAYMWVSTFRKENDGMHMLEYDTGRLLFSVRGHAGMRGWPAKPELTGAWYSYTAGCTGRGTLGQKGSMLSFATSENYPLGFLPKGLHGKGSVFWVDISKNYTNPFRG